MTPRATERLYWEDARRKTALAKVTARAGGGFLLDRTVFHASDARYHHAQPCDRGHMLAEGHKLKIDRVRADPKHGLVHVTSGPPPAPGADAQLHLDADRRLLQARAHALMHLLIAALSESRAEIVARPEVVGGGEVRAAARWREGPKVAWPKTVARVRQLVDARLPVDALWMPRDELAKRATPQHVALDAVAPGEPTLRVVRVGDVSLLPCDAPLVDATWHVGAFREGAPQPGRDGARIRLKVVA